MALNKSSAKAHYRSALALLALGRIEEAIDYCDRCLEFDDGNATIKELRDKAKKAKEEQGRKEACEIGRSVERERLNEAIKRALYVRNDFFTLSPWKTCVYWPLA